MVISLSNCSPVAKRSRRIRSSKLCHVRARRKREGVSTLPTRQWRQPQATAFGDCSCEHPVAGRLRSGAAVTLVVCSNACPSFSSAIGATRAPWYHDVRSASQTALGRLIVDGAPSSALAAVVPPDLPDGAAHISEPTSDTARSSSVPGRQQRGTSSCTCVPGTSAGDGCSPDLERPSSRSRRATTARSTSVQASCRS